MRRRLGVVLVDEGGGAGAAGAPGAGGDAGGCSADYPANATPDVDPVRAARRPEAEKPLTPRGADPDAARRAAAVIGAHGAAGLRERLARRTRRAGVVAARRRLGALLAALDVPD